MIPYSPPILLSRVKRLMESRYAYTEELFNKDILISNGIHVHFPSRTVAVDEENIGLTQTKYEILTYLMKNSSGYYHKRTANY